MTYDSTKNESQINALVQKAKTDGTVDRFVDRVYWKLISGV